MTEDRFAGGENDAVVPRDVRILHLILAAQTIQSYEDHVPLQLMDFAHRYTAGVLKDAVIYNDHARGSNGNGPASGKNLTTEDVRLAIAARTNYQFNPVTPKELLLELAAERNKKPLPAVLPGFGIRLPPEKYCLTARDWSLSDEDDEDEKMDGGK